MADLKDKFPVKSAVYFITDKETGKSYVGSTSNIQDRIKYHRNRLNKNIHNNKELQAAYNNNPGLEVIYAVVETKEEAQVMEQRFLDDYHSSGVLMNVSPGVNNTSLLNTPEIRSAVNAAKRLPENRERQSKIMTGRKFSEETKARMSKAHREAIPVIVDGVEYKTIAAAADAFGIAKTSASFRIKSPYFPTWQKK